MTESNREFGDLLSQGLRSVAARENKPILTLEDLLGVELGVTRSSIEKWRQGSILSDLKKVDYFARLCVLRGGMNQLWLRRFLSQTRFPEKETLIRELFPADEHQEPTVRRNFPRRTYDKFVGREQELARLQLFLSPRHRLGVICLNGAAGVGKTALALEIAHFYYEEWALLTADERFDAIVRVTAKQSELLPTGVATRRPTFTDLDGVYRALAEVLLLPAITRAATSEDRDIIVARALSEHRILLVMDNLESVDDTSLMIFLRDLPVPSKAIVTTRHRIDVAVNIHLRAFKENEAGELIRVECQKHDLLLTREQAEKLLQHTGCLALAIVRTIGRMAWRSSSIEIELQQLSNPTNSIYDFCFEKSIALIRGGEAHKLFMALALFSTGATREAIGYVAGFQDGILDRDEELSSLEVLSLLNKESDRFNLEILTKVKAQAELTAHSSFEQEARGRWVAWYKQLATQAENPTNYSSLRIEISNLLGVIDWLVVHKEMPNASWFFKQIRWFLFAEGQWEFLLYLAVQAASWAESTDDPELLAITVDSLSRVACEQGNYAYGHKWVKRAQALSLRLKNQYLQAEVWLRRAEIVYREGSVSRKEIDQVTQALEVFRHCQDTEKVIGALNTLGNLYMKQRRFTEAIASYQEGLYVLDHSECTIPRISQWRAALRANLALLAGRRGQYNEACQGLNEVLSDLPEQTDLADVYAAIALFEFYLGHIEQAQLARQQADQIIEQLKLIRPISLEDEEWTRLKRS